MFTSFLPVLVGGATGVCFIVGFMPAEAISVSVMFPIMGLSPWERLCQTSATEPLQPVRGGVVERQTLTLQVGVCQR